MVQFEAYPSPGPPIAKHAPYDPDQYHVLIVASIVLVVHLGIRFGCAKMVGDDILEHCKCGSGPQKNKPHKEVMCKIYENVGITSSLILTTVGGLLASDRDTEDSPDDHDWDNDVAKWYCFFGMLCLLASIACVILCVVSHFYLNSLSEDLAEHFMDANPTLIGEVVLYMAESYLFFVATFFLWFRVVHGATFGRAVLLIALLIVLNLVVRFLSLSGYKPPAAGKLLVTAKQMIFGSSSSKEHQLPLAKSKAGHPPAPPRPSLKSFQEDVQVAKRKDWVLKAVALIAIYSLPIGSFS